MALNFDKYAQEANAFVKRLAEELGHPEETRRTGIILRAVLHTLRDRITVSESFDVMAQLPMFLKAIYVDQWKYLERPKSYKRIEDFKDEVKRHQDMYGEQDFDWEKPTEEIIKTVIASLKPYLSQGELDHVIAQLPEEIEELVR